MKILILNKEKVKIATIDNGTVNAIMANIVGDNMHLEPEILNKKVQYTVTYPTGRNIVIGHDVIIHLQKDYTIEFVQ